MLPRLALLLPLFLLAAGCSEALAQPATGAFSGEVACPAVSPTVDGGAVPATIADAAPLTSQQLLQSMKIHVSLTKGETATVYIVGLDTPDPTAEIEDVGMEVCLDGTCSQKSTLLPGNGSIWGCAASGAGATVKVQGYR